MSAAEHNPSGQGLIPVADAIALAQAGVDNEKREIEVVGEFVAANERSEQRQIESVENQHARELEFRHTRHKTYKTVVYAVIAASIATVWFLLYNAFYGVGLQQEYALMIIKYLAIGLAGYGVISGIAGLFKRLVKPNEE